jgi:hypothetical protein
MLMESFEITWFLAENGRTRPELISSTTGGALMPTKTAVGRSLLSAAALELVQ